jgi:hypothetical protein
MELEDMRALKPLALTSVQVQVLSVAPIEALLKALRKGNSLNKAAKGTNYNFRRLLPLNH